MLDDTIHGQGHILVIEDDDSLRSLLVKLLTRSGYPATGVANGAAALAWIAADPPAALLLDQKLADMTGQQIIATLAEQGVALPFIVMTGQGDERLAVEMMKLGASDYLVKDVDLLDILPVAVERLFKAIEMERELQQTRSSLMKSEELYRKLLTTVPDLVIQTDLNGRVTFVNENSVLSLKHIPRESLLGRDMLSFIAEKDLPRAIENTRRMFDHPLGPQEYQLQFDNGPLEVEVNGDVIYDAGHHPTGMVYVIRDITERKRVEKALRESEAQYRRIISTAKEGIWALDANHRTSLVNLRMAEMLGYEIEEMLGHLPTDFLFEEDWPSYQSKMADRHQGTSGVYERRFRRKDGTVLWTLLSEVPIFDDEGRFAGAFAMFSDITERKRAAEELRVSEERFSKAFQSSPDAIAIASLESGTLIEVNEGFERVFGYSREEALGHSTLELGLYANPVDRERMIQMLRETGHVRDLELPGNRKSGMPLVAQLSVEMITIEGKPHSVTTARDITERKRAAEALRESEETYRALVAGLPDIVMRFDRVGRHLFVSENVRDVTGMAAAQFIGKTHTELGFPETLCRLWEDAIQQVFTSGAPFETEFAFEGPIGAVVFNWRLIPERDGRGAVSSVLSISRDITERKALETQLRRQEQLAAIGQLAAGIAHDFRNLLTTIILYAQLGQRKSDVPPTVAQYLAIIAGEAHKATTLVQQILDFSRRTAIERRPLDLAAFAGSVVAILQRTLPENIHITLETGPGAYVIEGDAGRLQQALMNLALNARDAMPTGGALRIGLRRIAVTPGSTLPLPAMLEALAPPAWICLSVADTGPGLTDAAYAHLFEPFFTTKEEGQGTGLGLAQVYGIIQLHHGYIDVENAPGHGVTFRLYLPAAAEVTEDSATTPAPLPTGQGETLLLVEDNAYLREAEQQLLIDLGYEVLTAANGREALALYQQERAIALLITDLVMPEMGGQALLAALRRDAPHLKALVMTGYTAEESEAELRAAGFLEVIRKPLDADRLAHAIHRALTPADVGHSGA